MIGVLWACFLGGAAGILSCLKDSREPGTGTQMEEVEPPALEEERWMEGAGERLAKKILAIQKKRAKKPEKGGRAKIAKIRPKAFAVREIPAAVQDEPVWMPEDPAKLQEDRPPVLYIASDLHYQSAETTDYGTAYQRFVASSDGKVVSYLPQILDALIDETILARPDALLLTGDITMNGEQINHQELAEKLHRLTEAGVPVLVIPGNHDINDRWASVYFGEQAQTTPSVSLEGFTQIYQEFGWDQAISRDEASFSYIYPLREDIWLMLLDTAQYDPVDRVEGAVRPETLLWMEEELKLAREEGVQVIVSGHHDLLQESRLFTTQCVLENNKAVIALLESYKVPLYISGHLHLQRTQKHKTEPGAKGYGIYEIVSDAISIPPCQYGILSWEETGALFYETRPVDVSGWAERTGQTDEDLLGFDRFKEAYLQDLIKAQILKKLWQAPKEAADRMARLYASIYADYCAGIKIDPKEVKETAAYQDWLWYEPGSTEWKEMHQMIKDSAEDHNTLRLWAKP